MTVRRAAVHALLDTLSPLAAGMARSDIRNCMMSSAGGQFDF